MIDFTKNLHPLSNLRDREEPEIFLSQGLSRPLTPASPFRKPKSRLPGKKEAGGSGGGHRR
jgi:hypothetical protein